MSKTLEERVQRLEDIDEIAKMQARYIDFNDGGWKGPTHQHPQEVADLFVDDGVWEGPSGTARAEGRQAIIDLFTQFAAVPFIIHCITNPLIEVDGDSAHGEWHAIIPTTMPDCQALWTIGKYINDYVRTEQGWKCKSMFFEAATITTYETGWGKMQFANQPLIES